MRQSVLQVLILALLLCTGCATTRNTDTPRTGLEQLLISNAVDRALKKIDFEPLKGSAVFLEEKYVDGIDKNYVLASIRHAILKSGVRLVASANDADIIVEARSGGVGTDRVDTFLGSPQLSVPGPMALALPEVKLVSRTTQIGTAKIGIVAYDAKTREVIGHGGVSLSRSNDHKWYVLGAGPFNSGTIRDEVLGATGQSVVPLPVLDSISFTPWKPKTVHPVSFDSENGDSSSVTPASEEEEQADEKGKLSPAAESDEKAKGQAPAKAPAEPGKIEAAAAEKIEPPPVVPVEETPADFVDDGWDAPENFPTQDVTPQNRPTAEDVLPEFPFEG